MNIHLYITCIYQHSNNNECGKIHFGIIISTCLNFHLYITCIYQHSNNNECGQQIRLRVLLLETPLNFTVERFHHAICWAHQSYYNHEHVQIYACLWEIIIEPRLIANFWSLQKIADITFQHYPKHWTYTDKTHLLFRSFRKSIVFINIVLQCTFVSMPLIFTQQATNKHIFHIVFVLLTISILQFDIVIQCRYYCVGCGHYNRLEQ